MTLLEYVQNGNPCAVAAETDGDDRVLITERHEFGADGLCKTCKAIRVMLQPRPQM